jgi:uncharacterized protein (DUF3084 family)
MVKGSTKPRKRRKDAGKPKELTEAHKRKMQVARERKRAERAKTEAKQEKTELRATIKRLQEHLIRCERENDKADAKYTWTSSEKNFKLWLQANTNLLNAVTALRAHEERLRREG